MLASLDRISETTAVAMHKAVGFRKIAVHNYGEISWEVVQAISHHRLNDFRQFAQEVAKLLP